MAKRKKTSLSKKNIRDIVQIIFFLVGIASFSFGKNFFGNKSSRYNQNEHHQGFSKRYGYKKYKHNQRNNETDYDQTPQKLEDGSVTTCFTPNQRCLGFIIREIDKAKEIIYLQGYSFTSEEIALALVKAHKRGVVVKAILDKSQKTDKRSKSMFIKKNGIDVKIDYKPAIAHNKIILIDHKVTITGSYNWTKGAEHRNAENLLIINQEKLTKTYEKNFETRWNVSNIM